MQAAPPTPGQARLTSSKRDTILEAATRVFLELGFEKASMEAVAQEAGAARRTVYNQFASKEALFNAAVERIWADMPVMSLAEDAQASRDPSLGLARIGDVIAGFWTDKAVAFMRMVISESSRFPDLAQNFVRIGKSPALQALIAYLGRLDAAGIIAVEDTDLAARQFVGLINEPLLWYRVIGVGELASTQERHRVVQEAVAMFLARYRSLPGAA